jgi:MFS family permease
MTAASAAPARLSAQRPFVLFWLSRLASTLGNHMLAVAIGWRIYDITNSAFDLGLVGLVQFIPAVVFTLLIGHFADRYDRRLIVRLAQGGYAIAAGLLLLAFLGRTSNADLLFGIVLLLGTARAFELPTSQSLVPALVPAPMVPRATAAWAAANQTAVICGPAAGGLLYAIDPLLVCMTALVLFLIAIAMVTLIEIARTPQRRDPPSLSSVLAGFRFVRARPRLFGVITLDLFVALLGGVTALLPIYARDILMAGPVGLGLLRSAPAIGALGMTIALSHVPLERRLGTTMLSVVALFGWRPCCSRSRPGCRCRWRRSRSRASST